LDVHRTLLVAHPAERMYDLIEGAEHYPAFLPWCAGAQVSERTDSVVAATIAVDWHGVRFDVVTRNDKLRPHWLGIRLERGPFRTFSADWNLKPLGLDGCRIDFALHFELAGDVLDRVAAHAFERTVSRVVDAFVRRADELGEAIPRLAYVDPVDLHADQKR
jgi:ribosome-associated toxin RatA of RatAB toxin-antitoxin module